VSPPQHSTGHETFCDGWMASSYVVGVASSTLNWP
jgi:hypothetical protein